MQLDSLHLLTHAALAKVLHAVDTLFPLLSSMPLEVKRQIVRGDGGWVNRWFGMHQPWEQPCKAVYKAKKRAYAQGKELVVVGHSLGGQYAETEQNQSSQQSEWSTQ